LRRGRRNSGGGGPAGGVGGGNTMQRACICVYRRRIVEDRKLGISYNVALFVIAWLFRQGKGMIEP